MSRSRRRVPFIRQEKKDCRSLNRKVRAAKLAEIPDGAGFKRFSSDWGGWGYIWTKEQAMQDYKEKPHIRERYSLEEWLEQWERWAVRK